MRVIAGKARSLPLKSVPGTGTRPTPDRIKETLFNILQTEIPGASFLDLFSGSGGIGIEALSRGAKKCVFVDHDKTAAAIIRQNLAFTKLQDGAKLYRGDYLAVLKKLEGREPFDIIFADPPYNQLIERDLLAYLKNSSLVCDDTLIIIEASLETEFPYLDELGFFSVKQKKYKTNQHLFVKRVKGIG